MFVVPFLCELHLSLTHPTGNHIVRRMVKFMANCYEAISQPRGCIIPHVDYFSSILLLILTAVLLSHTKHMHLQEHRSNENRIVLKPIPQNVLNYDIYKYHSVYVTAAEVLRVSIVCNNLNTSLLVPIKLYQRKLDRGGLLRR
jgi:hypothetical protein